MLKAKNNLHQGFCIMCVFITLFCSVYKSQGQTLNDAEVKTALVYNFIKYIEGESLKKKDTLVLSYLGDDNILINHLYQIENQKINGKKIRVIPYALNQENQKVDFIFIFNQNNFEITRIVRYIQNRSIFLITDRHTDQREIMINFIHRNDKVQFEINKKNILDAGFDISPKLLLLGGTEVDVRELYRDTERTLFEERERVELIKTELKNKQLEVDQITATMEALDYKNDSLNYVLIHQIQTIHKKEKSIDSLQSEYNNIWSTVELRKKELESTNKSLNNKNKEINNLDFELNEKQQNLEQASQSLDKLKDDISKKEELLIDQQNKLDLQRMVFWVLITFIILIIVFIIYIYVNYKANIRKNQELERYNHQINEQKEKIQHQADVLIHTNHELEIEKQKAHDTLNRLKNAQSQLVAAEKMVSLGQLTSGIAHEINNPINYISSNIEGLRNIMDDFKQLIELYDSIEDVKEHKEVLKLKEEIEYEDMLFGFNELSGNIKMGVDRTKEIINSLRTFARIDNDDFIKTDIHQTIDSAIILMGKQNRERISIVKDYGNINDVECSPGKLSQVFMNILVNAVQAIKNEGEIIITTREEKRNSKNYVCIDFKDNGTGIKQHVMDKIFEPFFTTKDVGEGTGLGLSISFSIIKKHNGFIEVESELDKGTTFKIYLPQ